MSVMLLGMLSIASAQQYYTPREATIDVVYTTEGEVLQGTIVEQVPGVEYTIVTLDGRQYTIDALHVKRITKERLGNRIVSENHNYLHNPYMKLDENGNPIYPLSVIGAFTRSLIIPGLGQMYNGDGLKGALCFTGALTGLFGITVGTNMVGINYEDLVGYSSAVLLIGSYLFSIIDAPIVAAHWNKTHGFRLNGDQFLNITPVISIIASQSTTSDTAVGMGLSLTF